MRVGSLVFATDQGLGYLAKDFYDHGIVTDPIVVVHGRREDHLDWYPNAPVIHSLGQWADSVSWIIDDVDAMLFFETPFVWELINSCRSRGVKTILMPMHECMPRELPVMPDVIACPSDLDFQLYQRKGFKNIVRVDVPVPDWVQWQERKTADVFVHNAGNGGLKGRNGTQELLRAWQLFVNKESNAKLLVRTQEKKWPVLTVGSGKPFDQRLGSVAREELYAEGDVFVFPEKFNGLSLPLQEAFASGMLVMAADRFPMNRWLPRAPLIPIAREFEDCISPRLEPFMSAVVEPKAIAEAIDRWHGMGIDWYSQLGKEFGKSMSWTKQKPKWDQLVEDVVKGRLP